MINILLVDDETIIIDAMTKIFSRYGDCTPVKSGIQAVEVFSESLRENNPFDLIILDISLEDKSGLDLLKEVRAMEKEKRISKKDRVKIVMATSNQELKTVKACIAQGCDNYILKPLKPDFVEEVLGKFGFKPIEKTETESEPEKKPEKDSKKGNG